MADSQLGVTLRTNKAAQYEATIGPSPKLFLFAQPKAVNCAAADPGVPLAVITLPVDWLEAPANGSVVKKGVWSGIGAAAAGLGTNVQSFRIKDNAETECHVQGTVTQTGGGGVMEVDNVNIAVNQAFVVTAFTAIEGNA